MSQENVELVRRAYEAWNVGNFDAASELLSPEMEWQMPPNLPESDTWRSKAEVQRGLEDFMQSWKELRAEVQDLIDAGDRVVALVRFRGRSAVTELELQGVSVDAAVWTVRDGKLAKVEMYGGTEAALEAVGLRE
jgi:ketosteroid isomerase-like protein